MFRHVMLACATLALAACGQTLTGTVAEQVSEAPHLRKCVGEKTGDLINFNGRDIEVGEAARAAGDIVDLLIFDSRPSEPKPRKSLINAFFDCTLGEVEIGEDELADEKRLLRGHMMLSLLAQHGNVSLTTNEASVSARQDLLMEIRKAQLALRQASRVASRRPKLDAPEGLTAEQLQRYGRNFYHVQRIHRVLQVALSIQEMEIRGIVRDATRIGALLGSGNPLTLASAQPIFGRAMARGRQALQVKFYGAALIEDAQSHMALLKPLNGIGAPQFREIWAYWDERLEKACEEMGRRAGVEAFSCIPATPGS
jgi:hypothetical protein